MKDVSQKLGNSALYILFLAGPILGLATKGFAPLIALSGILAISSLLMKPSLLIKIDWKRVAPALPFLFFAGLSLLWTDAEGGSRSFLVFISVIIFTFSLIFVFSETSEEWKKKYRKYLSFSLLIGVLASLGIGTYPIVWPELVNISEQFSSQTDLGNIELLRQSNRSLSMTPAILFLLAGFYWKQARWLVIVLFSGALFVIANSNSQTAFLALIGGGAAIPFTYFFKYSRRKLILAVTTIGLLTSPIIFLKSFEHKWVERYAPEMVQKKASGEYRQWIYFVFAKEISSNPFLGHGFKSTHNTQLENLDTYIDLAQQRKIISAINNATKNGTVAAHAHNFPLQIIFELGYIGALLFLGFLWALLNIRFAAQGRAPRAAAFAALIGLLLFAFSIWQSWLLACAGFILFYMIVLYGKQPNIGRAKLTIGD